MSFRRKKAMHRRTVRKGSLADELLNPLPWSPLGRMIERRYPADVLRVPCGGGVRIIRKG